MGLTRHLLPFFKDHHLTQITIAEVDRYKTTKVRERERSTHKRSLSNGSINETLNLLAQILELAVEYGHIQFNPARGRRRRLKTAQPKRTWLEPEQIKPLLDATVLGLRGGKTQARPQDARAVRHRDLHRTAHRRAARAALAGGRPRPRTPHRADVQDRSRHRPRDRPVARAARRAHRLQGKHPTWPTQRLRVRHRDRESRHPLEHRERLKRAVVRANEALAGQDIAAIPAELSPHSLRRTFASLLYLRGENPVYVMHQMGHADPKLALRIYTKVMGEQRRRGPGARLVSVLDGPAGPRERDAANEPTPTGEAHAGLR